MSDHKFTDDEDDGWDDEDDGNGWDDEKDGDWSESNDVVMEDIIPSQQTVTTPSEIAVKVRENVGEVQLIPFFHAACQLKGTRVDVSLGLRVREFGQITDEQLEVWGLSRHHEFIVIRLTFGPYYLQSHDTPKVTVGAAVDLNPLTELKTFRLSWTIKERIQNSFLSVFPPDDYLGMMSAAMDPEALSDLMEGSQQEYGLCLHALRESHGDQSNALVTLLNPSDKTRLEAKLPSAYECDTELNGVFATRREEAKIEVDTTQLISMYENVDLDAQSEALSEMFEIPVEAARFAIEGSTSYQEAVEQMSDPEYRSNVLTIAMEMFGESMHTVSHRNLMDAGGMPGESISATAPPAAPADRHRGGWLRRQAEQFTNLFSGRDRGRGRPTRSALVDSSTMTRTLAMMCKHNYLVRVLCFGLKTLLNGNKRCMICDKKMVFAGLKPGICSDKMCQYQYQEVGLGFSLADEIIKRGEILDLSISMLVSACRANRVEIFFPRGVRGSDEYSEESFCDGDSINVGKLMEVAEMIPEMDQLTVWATAGNLNLKRELTGIHPLMYGLLCWVLTSNRTHLRRLKDSEVIPELRACKAQFALASATPERESVFQRLKGQYGSFMAFHGSPMGNWHSIMRMGLKNYSGSKYMMHGQAMGAGIYLAAAFQTSLGYSQRTMHRGWVNSQFPENVSMMAVCEVIKTPELMQKYPGYNVWVVPNEEHIITRFFLIFDSGVSSMGSVMSNNLTIPEVVRSYDDD